MGLGRRLSPVAQIALVTVTMMACSAVDAFAQKNQKIPKNFDVLPISITSVVVQNGTLVANGLIGTNPFTAPLQVTALQSGGACPILDLHLAPIDLNVLGLRVQTSPICLQVTAYEGGGLLGGLLCSVANLLQSGVPLADVLSGLTTETLPRFLNGLTMLLDQALDQVTSNNLVNAPTGSLAASCTVLDLALGPVQLNLLGLEVILDNCDNGPVTVTITAIPGGGLLGDLLCSLTNLLNNSGNGTTSAIQQLLWNISRLLGGLLG